MSLVDNRVHLNDCEDDTQVSGESTATPTDDVEDSGAVIEGSTSIAFQIADAQEVLLFDENTAGSLFGPIDMVDVTVYLNVKHNLGETFASLGGQIAFGDTADGGAGDIVGYNVNGNDVQGLPYLFRFTAIKLDVSVIVASPGTNNVDYFIYGGTLESDLDHSAVRQIGYGSFNVEKAISTGKNAWMDGIYYIANSVSSTTGYAASILGGTEGSPETMPDLAADDIAVGAAMFANPLGSAYYIFAPTEWGDSAGVTTTGFAGTDEQWFFLGDNAGGHTVGVSHFPMRVVGNSTGTNTFILTRVSMVNTGTRAEFDFTNVDVDKLQLTGCTFSDFGVITMPAQDADKFFNNTVFNNCAQITLNDMDMDGCTWNGSTNVLGTILWDTVGDELNQINSTFNSTGTGHAIEISLNTASLTSFSITGYTVSGYETIDDGTTGNTVFIVDNDLDGDVNIAVNSGTGSFSYERAAGYTGTVTITQSVTVRVEGVTEGTSIKVVAAETAGTITIGDTIFELLADTNGAAEITSFNFEGAFGAGLDVFVRARNQGFPTGALQDDNGSYTDFTTESNSSTTNDMVMYPGTPVVNQDSFQFGHPDEFDSLKLELSTVGSGGFGVTWEYWDGDSWEPLSGVVDGTSNLTATGNNVVSWTIPGDWAAVNDGGFGSYKYVRVRFTSGTMSTVPLGRKAKLNVTRYLPFNADREIVSTGLTVVASWVEDTIASF